MAGIVLGILAFVIPTVLLIIFVRRSKYKAAKRVSQTEIPRRKRRAENASQTRTDAPRTPSVAGTSILT